MPAGDVVELEDARRAVLAGVRGRTPILNLPGSLRAIEPGTFLPGVGGARVEDLVVVGASGCERVTGSYPYGLSP